jgi:hypothetical protein
VEYKAFIGGSFPAQAWTLDAERTVNWYFERSESQGATARSALYPTPGVTLLDSATAGPGRGHFFMDGREFLVSGKTLYEVGQSGLLTSRGDVTLASDPVTINSNGDGGGELFITSGGNGWLFNLGTNTLSVIGALAGKAEMGAHLDGYFLALDRDTSTLFVSELLDGTTWNTGTKFAQRSAASDPWVSLVVLGRYIWLLGEQTSEVWYDSGASFPFELHPSGLVPYGIAAPASAAVGDAALYWLGTSKIGGPVVMRSTGFTPEVISHAPMELRISEYTTISDAFGECYSDNGHTFYVLTFPNAEATWVYDARSGVWSGRATWIAENNAFTAWRPMHHAYAFGEHRILDRDGRGLYRLGRDVGTDVESRVIRRIRRAPALVAEGQRIYYSAFELDMEVGLGTTGQGENPQVGLRISNDGGKSWGPENLRSAGKTGEFAKRVRWDRLGASRRRVFEVSVSDPIPWRLTNAYLRLGQPVSAQPAGAGATQ